MIGFFRHKLMQDIIINSVFAVIRLVSILWMIRFAGSLFTPIFLGLFLLSRRWSDVGGNLLQLGLSQTLLKYVPASNKRNRLRFLVVAVSAFLVIGFVCALLFFGLKTPFTLLFFGNNTSDMQQLAFWTVVLMWAMVLNFITMSFYLAERRMLLFNVISLLNGSGILLVVLFAASIYRTFIITPVVVIRLNAYGIFFCSTVALLPLIWDLWRTPNLGSKPEWINTIRQFVDYGITRSAITVLDSGFFLLGPWLLRAQPERAAHLLIALTLIRAGQAAIVPVSQVAMVVTAKLVTTQREDVIPEGVRMVFGISCYGTLVAFALIFPWRNEIVDVWLGQELAKNVTPFLSILLWGLLPYVIFQSLKGIVETRWTMPLNLFTFLIGMGLHLLVFFILEPITNIVTAISLSLLVSLWAMGALTIWWLWSDIDLTNYQWGWGWVAGFLFIVFLFNEWLTSIVPGWVGLGLGVAVTMVLGSIFPIWRKMPFVTLINLHFSTNSN